MLRLLCLIVSVVLLGCSAEQRGEHEIWLGTMAGPETELVMVAKDLAKRRYGLDVKVITFEDYILPNTALAEGDIDANLFQHQPYLDIAVAKKGYEITSIGKLFVYPMGIYSRRHHSIPPQKARVGIPNDPSNAARALRLMATNGWIEIDNLNDLELTPKRIKHNPYQLEFIEMGAAQLPRSLDELDYAAINTNFAVLAKLNPAKDAVLLETKDSPYANIVVVRSQEQDQQKYQHLIQALYSAEVQAKAKQLFNEQAIPAW